MDFKIINDLSEYRPWGGAVDTYQRIKDLDLVDELDMLMSELYPEGLDLMKFNDILWFDSEWVFETLGIESEEE